MRTFWTAPNGQVLPILETKRRLNFGRPAHALLRAYIFARDGYQCCKCGWKPADIPVPYSGRFGLIGPDVNGKRRELQLDHIVPLAAGGTNHPENFQTLCFACNASKRDRKEA